jgi:hypothetical protein
MKKFELDDDCIVFSIFICSKVSIGEYLKILRNGKMKNIDFDSSVILRKTVEASSEKDSTGKYKKNSSLSTVLEKTEPSGRDSLVEEERRINKLKRIQTGKDSTEISIFLLFFFLIFHIFPFFLKKF